jgi:hypothetical protein
VSRCAGASLQRGDELAGSASTVRSFLLLEDPGPWGVAILRDSRLPGVVRTALGAVPGVRPLLIRRSGRQASDGVRVFAVHVGASGGWAETTVLDSVEEVVDLDLAPLAAGRSIGLEPHVDPLVLVCTHGRHDACCAERGRPVALALDAAGLDAWECSHIGGDRFAGNVLVLPDGIYYGRVGHDAAEQLVRDHLTGTLDLDRMRGRSSLPMPVQAAEVAVRRRLGATAAADVQWLGHSTVDTVDRVVRARFTVPGGEAVVHVRTTLGPDSAPLTCQATRSSALPHHEIVGIELTGARA